MDKDFGEKVWWMKRFTRRLLIVTDLDDFSLVKCWCFAKFTNLPCQTLPLYSSICYTMSHVSCSHSEIVQCILSKKSDSKRFNGKAFTVSKKSWNIKVGIIRLGISIIKSRYSMHTMKWTCSVVHNCHIHISVWVYS